MKRVTSSVAMRGGDCQRAAAPLLCLAGAHLYRGWRAKPRPGKTSRAGPLSRRARGCDRAARHPILSGRRGRDASAPHVTRMMVDKSRREPRAFLRALFDAALAAADPARALAAAPAAAAARPHRRGRRRQGRRRRWRAPSRMHWPGPLVGPRRHALRPRRPLRAHRDRRGEPSGARRRRAAPPPRASSTACAGSDRRRSRAVPRLGRRLGAAGAAGAGPHARRQAGGDARAAALAARRSARSTCVRKHLSAIKGGRLAAAAAPAQIVTLAISDVPGDDPGGDRLGPDRARSDRPSPTRARVLAKYAHRAAAGGHRASRRRARTRRRSPAIRGFARSRLRR